MADREFEKAIEKTSTKRVMLVCGGSASGKSEFLSHTRHGYFVDRFKELSYNTNMAECSRREFLRGAITAAEAGTIITIAGCTTDDGSKPPALAKAPSFRESTLPQQDIFYIAPDVPLQMHREIIDAVRGTRQWFLSRNIPFSAGVSVFVSNSPDYVVDQYLQRAQIQPGQREKMSPELRQATAWIGVSRDIYIITGNPGWTQASPIIGGPIVEGRIHIIAHESFHIAQRELGAYRSPPVAWMNEGSGHYVAAVMLSERRIYDYQGIRDGHVMEALGLNEPLGQLESQESFHSAGNQATADEYSLAFLAVEFLTRGLPNRGINGLVDYWRKIGQGISHPLAFEQAFGKTTQNFYREFEQHRNLGF